MSPFESRAPKKFLLQVTGSIAAFKAVALCSKLTQLGHEVEVVLSEGAEKFVGAASFEGFTRRKVHTGLYDTGSMMAHIDLERWADAILLYPASANTIGKIATGQADSLIGALFLAHEFKKPYFIAPAMNQAMYKHPAMQENLKKLESWGIKILSPEDGFLACGETGAGRLVEPETVIEKLNYVHSKKKSAQNSSKKILITSGGTSEPIDAVRSITNFSTGETGYRLAESLKKSGHQVTLIQSRQSKFAGTGQISYTTTSEFTDQVKSELENHDYDYLIHAAAVADYHVVNAGSGKIQSELEKTLTLKPNPKVIKSVRQWSKNKDMKVISFKLTADSDMKLDGYDSEWTIHNELRNVNGEQHRGTIYNRERIPAHPFQTKSEMNQLIQTIIEGSNP